MPRKTTLTDWCCSMLPVPEVGLRRTSGAVGIQGQGCAAPPTGTYPLTRSRGCKPSPVSVLSINVSTPGILTRSMFALATLSGRGHMETKVRMGGAKHHHTGLFLGGGPGDQGL